jgi:hypothetical protein
MERFLSLQLQKSAQSSQATEQVVSFQCGFLASRVRTYD